LSALPAASRPTPNLPVWITAYSTGLHGNNPLAQSNIKSDKSKLFSTCGNMLICVLAGSGSSFAISNLSSNRMAYLSSNAAAPDVLGKTTFIFLDVLQNTLAVQFVIK